MLATKCISFSVVVLCLVSFLSGCASSSASQQPIAPAGLELRLAESESVVGLREATVRESGSTIYLHPDSIVPQLAFESLDRVTTESGSAALEFHVAEEQREAFAAATAANIGKRLCWVLDGEVLVAATINDRIVGRGQISGLTEEEIDRLVRELHQR